MRRIRCANECLPTDLHLDLRTNIAQNRNQTTSFTSELLFLLFLLCTVTSHPSHHILMQRSAMNLHATRF